MAKEKKPSYGGKQYSLQGAGGTASGAAEYTNAYRSSDSILVVHCSSFRGRPPGAALSSHRKLLSRTTEDAVTVTSPLIPWNTCGMTQATILNVPTLVYLPYSFFNLLSPLISIFVACIGFKIVRSVKKN